MSESIFALVLAAGLGSAGLWAAPPVLPPETTETGSETSAPPVESAPPSDTTAPPSDTAPPPSDTTAPPSDPPPPTDPPPELAPPGGRTTLPPGLQPVPFPLDERPHTPPTPLDTDPELGPPQQTSARRSIVDLRDPFDRPPPRPRPTGTPDGVRLLMPDLKDPFAPGLARVRSQRLDAHVPNDIRDPFRDRPHAGRLPPCVRTTGDGTVVQTPNGQDSAQCERSVIDLRDPFVREQ